MSDSTRYGWHFLDEYRELRHSNGTRVFVGKKLEWRTENNKIWYRVNDIQICKAGMHASSKISDAHAFAENYIYLGKMGWLCRVRVNGTGYDRKHSHSRERDNETPKFVGTHRTVLGMVPVKWLRSNISWEHREWDRHIPEIFAEMRRRNKKNHNNTEVR